MAYPKYEWMYDDTRLVIYDWLTAVQMLNSEARSQFELFNLRKCEDEFEATMKEDNITATYVSDIPRTVNGKLQRGYWVLAFKSTGQATLFKLKYGHAL